jgi:hypothetical protein
MDSPKAMDEDQFREDATSTKEDEAQYKDNDEALLHEHITRAKYIHLCDGDLVGSQIHSAATAVSSGEICTCLEHISPCTPASIPMKIVLHPLSPRYVFLSTH